MSTPLNVQQTAETSDAKPCPKCQENAFVPAIEYRDGRRGPASTRGVWFCFECGYQDK